MLLTNFFKKLVKKQCISVVGYLPPRPWALNHKKTNNNKTSLQLTTCAVLKENIPTLNIFTVE